MEKLFSSQQRKQTAPQQMTGASACDGKRLYHTDRPLLQDLSIITTDLMILWAFSSLNDSMILSHVRTHTCKRLSILFWFISVLATWSQMNIIFSILFIYLRIFMFEFKHFHKLRNFSFATASEFAQQIDCWSCYTVWINWATAWKGAIFPHDK